MKQKYPHPKGVGWEVSLFALHPGLSRAEGEASQSPCSLPFPSWADAVRRAGTELFPGAAIVTASLLPVSLSPTLRGHSSPLLFESPCLRCRRPPGPGLCGSCLCQQAVLVPRLCPKGLPGDLQVTTLRPFSSCLCPRASCCSEARLHRPWQRGEASDSEP